MGIVCQCGSPWDSASTTAMGFPIAVGGLGGWGGGGKGGLAVGRLRLGMDGVSRFHPRRGK